MKPRESGSPPERASIRAEPRSQDSRFARRVLLASALVAGVVAVCALTLRHPEVLLLAFGGVLAAVFLDALARPLISLGLPRAAAVPTVAALLLLLTAGAGALIGPRIAGQMQQLGDSLPQLVASAERTLTETALGRQAMDAAELARESPASPDWQRIATRVFGSLAGIFTTTLGVAAGTLALFALAVFLAVQPEAYLRPALLLFPPGRRERLREVLGASAHALRWWIIGRSVAMAIVAALTAAGLALLGVELALTLGLIAGAFTFVPYVGPILAAAPALLVALASGVSAALQVGVLYVGVQLVENYLLTPLVQGRAVALPPALLLFAQLLMGALLGLPGLVLATPLLVVLVVSLQALYVNDVLGERVPLLGERR
jgi:predicted PurR-regulated permease PerM